jgi:hypothetical protein
MKDPYKPFQTGCAPQDGYTHGKEKKKHFVHELELILDLDAQCIVYRGPDKKYFGRDICYGYNEDTLTIYDVTNKNGPNAGRIISRTPYVGASYTHQVSFPGQKQRLLFDTYLTYSRDGYSTPCGRRTSSWTTSWTRARSTLPAPPPTRLLVSTLFFLGFLPNHNNIMLIRTLRSEDGYPVSYVWDITSLEAPKNTGYYKSSTRSVDHNQFVHEGLAYQSNYQAGLRILDVSSIPKFPDASKVEEIAYFDVFPQDDDLPGKGSAVWDSGTWSHFTFPRFV